MNEYAATMRNKEASMNDANATPPASAGTTSVPGTGASSPPTTTNDPTETHSIGFPPSLVTPKEEQDQQRNGRRRLQDDATTAAYIDKLHLNAPQFLGKTPVKDIADILPANNLPTHMSKYIMVRLNGQRTIFLRRID